MKTHKKQLTVQSLRKSGAKVRVCHSRRFVPVTKLPDINFILDKDAKKRDGPRQVVQSEKITYNLAATGGRTAIEVDLSNGNFYKADALTSNKDYYNKRRGLVICLGRLFKQMVEDGEAI